MPGFLDSLRQMQFNRSFANAGQPHNDMLGRYGNQVPPNPGPGAMPNNMGNGFLDGLMMQQGATVPPMGLSPAESQASEVRAPRPGGGFVDSLSQRVSDNSGMLMGLGSGLLSRGWAGVGDAMPGMEYDENRRAMEEQQAQMEAQRAAQMRLGEQYGVDPLMFDAGLGEQALTSAMAPPSPGYSILSPQETAQMGLPDGARFQRGPDGRITQIGGGGTNVTVNNGGDSAAMERIGESIVDESAEAIAAGQSAARTQQSLNELDQLLANAPQGMAGGVTAMANGLGIPVEGGDEVAAAQAILNQLAPQQRPEGSGPMSDADLRLFQASLPRIINQPGGNQIILRGMQALNQYDQARGQIAAQYQDMILQGAPQQQAARFYREQMNQLNARTPSLGQMMQQAGVQASQPSSRGMFDGMSDAELERIANGN
jgi:hypothetical protein